jgi:hypothetical protein
MREKGIVLLLVTAVLFGLPLSVSPASHDEDLVAPKSARRVFTTTVDWYKPPLNGLDSGLEKRIPYRLVVSPPTVLRREATVLLGGANIVLLTREQAMRFAGEIDPDAVLRADIDKQDEKLLFFQKNPLDEALLRRFGKRAFDQMKEDQQTMIRKLRSEIAQLCDWEHELKPYLIKAVALQTGGKFSASFHEEDLIIHFGGMGSQGVPMERCPVIAFLPIKPRHVYTTVGMTR